MLSTVRIVKIREEVFRRFRGTKILGRRVSTPACKTTGMLSRTISFGPLKGTNNINISVNMFRGAPQLFTFSDVGRPPASITFSPTNHWVLPYTTRGNPARGTGSLCRLSYSLSSVNRCRAWPAAYRLHNTYRERENIENTHK